MSEDEYLDLCTPKCSACHHPGHSKRSRKCPLHPDNRINGRAHALAPAAPAPVVAPAEDSPSLALPAQAEWGVAAMSCEPVPCVVVGAAMVEELEAARLELVRRAAEIARLDGVVIDAGLTALRDRVRTETAETELARCRAELAAEAQRAADWEALAIASDTERDAAVAQVAELRAQLSSGEVLLAGVTHERDVLRTNLAEREADVATLAARWDGAWKRARLWHRAARKLYGEVLRGEKEILDLGGQLFQMNLDVASLRSSHAVAKAMGVENAVQRNQLTAVEAERRALTEEVNTLRDQFAEQGDALAAQTLRGAQLTEEIATLRAQLDEARKAPPAPPPPPAPPAPKKRRGEKGALRRTAIRRHRRMPVRTRFLLREVKDELRLVKLVKSKTSRTIDEIERDRRRTSGAAPLPRPPVDEDEEDDDEVATDDEPEEDDDDA